MDGTSYSAVLQDLAIGYYNYTIPFEEYRERRRQILNTIDACFNGMPYAPCESLQVSPAHACARNTTLEPSDLGGTERFSVQETLDTQDKKI